MIALLQRFFKRDEGQSLVLIAGGFAMLLGAAALAIDWGYSYAERRAMANAGQSAALAAGRLLAGSAVVYSANPTQAVRFDRTQEDAYLVACSFAQQNMGSVVEPATYNLTIQFLDSTGAQQASIARSITRSSCNQPSPAPSPTIPPTTMGVRVTTTTTYPSLFGSVLGTSTITAAGSGRSRIGGSTVSSAGTFGSGTPWAMVGHYDASQLVNTCGSPCNPTNATPVTFWGNSVPGNAGNFNGLIDYSRYSQWESGGTVPQLITDWDRSGSVSAGTTVKANQTGTASDCPSNQFDTAGTTVANDMLKCYIPNWTYYGFQGTLSLTTDHSSVTTGQHVPSAIGTRSSICASPPSYLFTPSCGTGNSTKGDWVETYARTGANGGNNISGPLSAAIALNGSTNVYSTKSCGNGCTYGKALTVMVYLWDCAEYFDSGTGTWGLIWNKTGTDCADMSGNGNCNNGVNVCWSHLNGHSPDRLHVFTYAPFTFYEGLVSTTSIQGFWGGGFGNPNTCPASNSCSTLNNVSNTTWLVGEQ